MLHADLDTLQRVRVVLAEAMEKGWDPAEALDRAGLLDHPAKKDAGVKAALVGAARMLDEYQVAQLAAEVSMRMPQTALDTKRLVVSWLEHTAGRIK